MPAVGCGQGWQAQNMVSERYGKEQVIRPRLGQGSFKAAILDEYGRACAVSHEHSEPVLEAAHIRPYTEGGEHVLQDRILLRSDIHKLFDGGWVTVTPDHRFEVSRQLKERFHNGRSYDDFHGRRIHGPKLTAHWPDPQILSRHNERKYRG